MSLICGDLHHLQAGLLLIIQMLDAHVRFHATLPIVQGRVIVWVIVRYLQNNNFNLLKAQTITPTITRPRIVGIVVSEWIKATFQLTFRAFIGETWYRFPQFGFLRG